MTQIDWSKAPEGATHWGPKVEHLIQAWFKRDGKSYYIWQDNYGWNPMSSGIQPLRLQTLVELQAPWTGEGPPPVGTKVTIETCGLRIWEEAEMFVGPVVEVVSTFKLTNSDMVVVYLEDENACCVFRASMCRMPKMAAQLAAEEREKAIADLVTVTCISHGEAARIFDAGYRKVEVKP